MKKFINYIDSLLYRLPETIFIPKWARKVALILFYYGGMVNVAIFLFLLLTLWHGWDPFGLKELIQANK